MNLLFVIDGSTSLKTSGICLLGVTWTALDAASYYCCSYFSSSFSCFCYWIKAFFSSFSLRASSSAFLISSSTSYSLSLNRILSSSSSVKFNSIKVLSVAYHLYLGSSPFLSFSNKSLIFFSMDFRLHSGFLKLKSSIIFYLLWNEPCIILTSSISFKLIAFGLNLLAELPFLSSYPAFSFSS